MGLRSLFISFLFLFVISCDTTSKMKSSQTAGKTGKEENVEYESNIVLHDKPLETIKRNVVNRKWQMLYRIGGLTGDDIAHYDNTFITITDNEMIREENGEEKRQKINWKPQRDITTGDATYVISGFVNWKVEGIYNDSLKLADNYYDGYGYTLIPAKNN